MIPRVEIPRSSFNRSHGYKTTFNEGYLIPFYVDEALPGDTFNCNATLFARLATPVAPIMDNMYLETFFFAVPVRLIWDNWKKFNGEQVNPDDSTDFLVPQITSPSGGWPVGSLSDYFGLPTGISNLSVWCQSEQLHLVGNCSDSVPGLSGTFLSTFLHVFLPFSPPAKQPGNQETLDITISS
jgi:hypothetical protein